MTPIQSWGMVIAAMVIIVIIWRGAKSKGRCWEVKTKEQTASHEKDEFVSGLLDNALLAVALKDAGWRGSFWDIYKTNPLKEKIQCIGKTE